MSNQDPPLGIREGLKYSAGILALLVAFGLAIFGAWGRINVPGQHDTVYTRAAGGNSAEPIEIGALLAFAGAALGIAAYERNKWLDRLAGGNTETGKTAGVTQADEGERK